MVSRAATSSAFKWSAINAVLSLAVKLGALVVLSRILGPAEFGVYNIGMAFVLILSTIGQLGIPTNIVSLDALRTGAVSSGIILGLASGGVLAAISCGAVAIYDIDLILRNRELAFLFSVLLSLQIAINILEALAKRALNFKLLAVNELVASFIGNGLFPALLALIGWKAIALVAGQIVYSLFKLAVLGFKNRDQVLQSPRFQGASDLTAGSFSIMTAEAANMATVHIQRPMVGQELGAAAAGVWSRVYQIILIELTIVIQPLDNVILPIFSRLRAERERFSAGLVAAIQAVGLTTLPIAALTVVWTPVMVPILFGPAWLQLIVPLQIGSCIVFFRGIERVLLSVSRAAGTMKVRAYIQVVQLALIVACLFPALRFGLVASSWAYIGALALGFVVSLVSMRMTTGLGAVDVMRALAPGVGIASGPLALGAVTAGVTGRPLGDALSVCIVTAGVAVSGLLVMLKPERFLSPLLATAIASNIARLRRRGATV